MLITLIIFVLLFNVSVLSVNAQYGDINDNVVKHFWATLRQHPPFSLETSTPSTRQDWEQRATIFNNEIGLTFGLSPMPAKTPLNIQDFGIAVSGNVNGVDYQIRKIVFESEPKNYVTCNLYLPLNVTYPVPCVIFTHGHSGSKSGLSSMAMVFISHGIAALAMDFLGYGERKPQGYEHDSALTYPILIGGFKTLETWAGVRALDYLETRPEIDMTRIGWTGNSGGGTQAQCMATIGLIDQRVKAIAPAGAISSWESMTWPTSGHCQCNVMANIARYMDHSDMLSMVAQRYGATQILTGTNDNLQATQTDPLGSGRTAYSNLTVTASHILYVHQLYGNTDAYFPTINSGHGFEQPKREAMYGFMLKILKNEGDGSPLPEPSVPSYNDSVLNCYPSGVVPSDARHPVQLVYYRVKDMISRYQLPQTVSEFSNWQSGLRTTIIDKVFGLFPSTPPFNAVIISSGDSSDYRWEKISIETEVTQITNPSATYKIVVPFYLIIPKTVSLPRPTLITLHEDGKNALFISSTGFIEQNLNEYIRTYKYIVVCVDPRSIGETFVHWQNQYELAKWSSTYGRPMFGRLVYDIKRVIDYLETRNEIDMSKLGIIGFGKSGKKLGAMLALYTSALDTRIKVTVAECGMATYAEQYDWSWWFFHWYIPIYITPYADIPQVAALIAPRALTYCAPESASSSKNKFNQSEIDTLMSFTSQAYRLSGAPSDRIKLISADSYDRMSTSAWQTINTWIDTQFNITEQISVDTYVLDFGEIKSGEKKQMCFNITNTGNGVLTGTITTDQDWITVDPASFVIPPQAGIQTVNVTVDNNVLNKTEGQYTGTITVTSNGGTEIISVIVTATCVLVKPNPYNPNKGLLSFFGSGIVPGKTTIKIYTLSGELVKEITSSANNGINWDGKNEIEEPVASGIYLYIYTSPKEKGIGKFTIIKN